MAQTGYTPILIYSSSTTTNAPAAGSLTNSTLGSELAINITDGKLFYKDNANAVQVIAWKTTPTTAGGTGLTSYNQGDLLYYNTGTTLTALAKNTSATRYLSNTGSNNNPAWAQIDLSNGVTGTLPVGNGGTGATTFTAGRVLFGNTTSAINTSANLFWDNSNNRLGLGTASPTNVLDITSTARPQAKVSYNGTSGIFFTDATTASYKSWQISSSEYNTNTLQFTPSTANGGTTFTTPTVTFKDTGEVGFGTATPGAQFDLYRSGTTDVKSYVRNATVNFWVRVPDGTQAQLGTETNHPLLFLTSNSERGRFDTSGNLSIANGNLVIGTSGKGIDFSAAGGDVLTQYDEYTAASTACQNAITTACVWKLTKIGNQVTITLPKVTGTAGGSNVNFVLGANIPSAYRPTADIGFYGATIINNGAVVTAPGFILITTAGSIIVYRDSSGLTAWTNGATAGLNEALGISWTI